MPPEKKDEKKTKKPTATKKTSNITKTSSSTKTKEPVVVEKKEPQFNLRDGWTKEDWQAIWNLIKGFFIGIFKIIFSPILWFFNWIAKTIHFLRVPGDNTRPLTDEERYYVESIPVVIILTGLLFGIILGIVALFEINDFLKKLFSLGFTDAVKQIWSWVIALFKFIWWLLVVIVKGIWQVIDAIISFFNAIVKSPFIAIIVLGITIMVLILLYLVLTELEIFNRLWAKIADVFTWVMKKPQDLYAKIVNAIRKMNHYITQWVVGGNKLNERSHKFFKKVVSAVLAFAFFFLLIAGTIAWQSEQLHNTEEPIKVCLLFSFLAGFIMFRLTVETLNLVARGKYRIPPVQNKE